MQKAFDRYSVEVWASVAQGIAAQILFDEAKSFVGRIDFYGGQNPAVSYLWHPNGTSDPTQIYIVLAMSLDLLDPVIDLLQHGGPWAVELWPSGPLTGAFTDGYGGVLMTTHDITVPATALNIRAIRA
jgi:hypothetical protein